MTQIIVVLVILLAAWDLWKQELPIVFLILLSVAAGIQFLSETIWVQCLQGVNALVSLCLFRWQKSGEIGSGDIWVLICLGLAWPADIFWHSLFYGFLMISITAILKWSLTKNQDERIPLIPFLLMGYWI